ncbi:MAG TPA: AAA family ATPase [Pirellulales bacterium]|nr:AAA family ATPase [Pirellulales bacterium]
MMPSTASEFRGTDRFRVIRRVGAGGMGVVYEAFDRERDARVALKFLPDADPTALSRFKQEFRALADVSHPNLAALYELFSDQDQWFFTMEFVDGVDFLGYVRGLPAGGAAVEVTERSLGTSIELSPDGFADAGADQTLVYQDGTDSLKRLELSPRQIERLRGALRQLVNGVERLHALDIIHRDIKPSNVLVTPAGRVVLLDFGLAVELHDPHESPSAVSDVAGTVGYMSPEQVQGRVLSPASDWYNIGAMLYEVLTGRRPYSGDCQQIMLAKVSFDPAEPKSLAPGTPDDLNQLCMDLLCRAPRARADGKRILERCDSPDTAPPGEAVRRSSNEFVGRQSELAELSRAYARVRGGKPCLVLIEGESGVGKSALVHRFLEDLAGDGQVILAGRCYEQESVPFKAFDTLIDALTRYLSSLAEVESAALLPRDILALARIFPVIEQVPMVAKSPSRRAEVPDQRELRRRAFAALRELLARIADRRPLVLVIDDLQWGDVDSANLLNDLLEPPDPPLFLFIGAYRSEDAGRSACLQLLLASSEQREETVSRTRIALAPLSQLESVELAVTLLGSDDELARSQANQIVSESQGSPYFVCELAQHVREGIQREARADDDTSASRIRLDDALWQRIERLPTAERTALEVLSVAVRPLRPADAFAAAGIGEPLAVLRRLRSDRFIRVMVSLGEELLAPYHDRIRETILARLTASATSDHHRRLAGVLTAAHEPDVQILAMHFEGAGDSETAGGYYALAAAAADAALAFDRAAELYRKALALKPLADDERGEMLRKLADALANAGRGTEAAQQYLAAAAEAPPSEALLLRGKAGFQFCAAGDIDAGRESLAAVLERLGLSLPVTRNRALLSLLYHRCRLRLRGTRFRERREADVPARLLTRVDVTWSVAVGLTMIDTIRGADFQTRNLLLALRTGEPYRVARALAWEATHVAMGGVAGRRRARRMLDAAGQIAERLHHPHARGMTMMGRGVSAFFLGDWREAHEICDRAVALFTEGCTGAAWELDTSQAFAYWSLFWLGKFAEIQDRFPRLVNEAHERGDRLAAANFATFGGPFVFLSQDDPQAAGEALDGAMGVWSQQDFHVQHFTTLSARTYVALYRGHAADAWRHLLGEWSRLRASFLLNVECVRIFMRHLRSSCALAAAEDSQTPASQLAELEREAGRDARRLERERPRYARPLAMLIRAALAARSGQPEAAADLLAGAISLLDSHQLGIYAAAARYRRGQLLGGEQGDALVQQATDWMREQRILRPERIAALFAPGFGLS